MRKSLSSLTIAVINVNQIPWQRKAEIENSFYQFMLEAKQSGMILTIEEFVEKFNNCQIDNKTHSIALSHKNYFIDYEYIKLKKQILKVLEENNEITINVNLQTNPDEYNAMQSLHHWLLKSYNVETETCGDYVKLLIYKK